MAAAALGNTFSDIMGIGSAWYIESLAAKVGLKPPALSPIQLDMKSSRWAANMVSKALIRTLVRMVKVLKTYSNTLLPF